MGKHNKIKTIAFDLDNTICNSIRRNHPDDILRVKPRQKYVELIDKLHTAGYKILIFTSRDSCGEGARDLTIQWLKKYQIYYDTLITNKPHYDLFIDDRTISSHRSIMTFGFIDTWCEYISEDITKHTYRGTSDKV